MSEAESTRIRQMSFANLKKMGAYDLQRLIESSSKVVRQMILRELGQR